MDPRTDEELLAAVDGEPEAFGVFYGRHVRPLLGYFVRRTGDAELAADLCAETFAAALDGLRRYDPSRGPAVAWLYGIGRRLLIHAARRGVVEDRARRRLGMAPLELTDAAIERIEAEADEVATAALDALPHDQREAVRARVLDERDYADIARTTRTSEAVVRKRGSRPADERPSVPPAPGVDVALPAAEAARPCPGVEQRRQAGDAPQPYPLKVFTRPQTVDDVLPPPTALPTGTVFPDGSRRAGAGHFGAEVRLVPIAEPRAGGRCDGELQAALGVCLVVDAVVRCFSDEQVEAGRALAVTSPGVVHGIAPDGAGRVTLHAGGQAFAADVHENAYEIVLPVDAGEDVRVELERVAECRPSSELLDALPALREGAWQTVPGGAGLREWARRVEAGDGLELWAVAHCDGVERACVVVVHDGRRVAESCAAARDIRGPGTWSTFPVAGGVAIAGMAPPGTRGVEFGTGDRARDLPFAGGVFGGLLSSGPVAPGDVRFVR